MADLIGAVTKATGSFLQSSIDNWGFKLFYKATTSILIACSVLVTMAQFFGSPIQCDAGSASGGVEKDVLESYCWRYSTWSVPTKYKGVCSAHGVSHICVPTKGSQKFISFDKLGILSQPA